MRVLGAGQIRGSDSTATGTAITFDPELSRLVRRAGWSGQGDGDQPVVSFTSLFLAFFAAHDLAALKAMQRSLQDPLGRDSPEGFRRAVRQVARFSFATGRLLTRFPSTPLA
jgi:hypothetical protein